MKMSKVLLASSAILLLVSCGRIDSFEGLYSRAKGEEIVFGVSSSGGGVFTKSTYSGEEIASGDKYYERIDWVEGEKISLACAKVSDIKTFNYDVVSVENSGRISYAGITHEQGEEGLRWGNDGDYYFYAESPSSSSLMTSGQTVFILPKDQTGTGSWNSASTKYTVAPNPDYMHMTSYSVVTKNGSAPAPPVDLPFSMLPTVIEFTLSGEDDMVVKNIGLLSDQYLTGRSEVDIASQAKSTASPKPEFPECTTTEGFNEVWLSTMASGGSPVEIEKEQSLTGTLFLNPTDITHLSFCITTKDDGAETYTTRKTSLKYASGDWLTFDAHKKYRIKGIIVPGGVKWVINYDPTVEQWNNSGETPINPVPGVDGELFVTSWDSGVDEDLELKNIPPGGLDGLFSVSDKKKVYFSQGNMFYNGKTFEFEPNQYYRHEREELDVNHVTHFYWSKSADVAKNLNYIDPDASESDVFFTNATQDTPNENFTVYGVTAKYRILSNDEWQYLLNTRTVNGGTGEGHSYSIGIIYNGIGGIVLYPDDYNGATVSGNITALPDKTVFLPMAGNRENSQVFNVDNNHGYYWSSTVWPDYLGWMSGAHLVCINANQLFSDYFWNRGLACSIRLVTDAN